MRHPFENWLDSQLFSYSPLFLFREAVTCYKAGAYRASMIMSYVGMQNVIKERILNASKPAALSAGYWNEVAGNGKNGLRNDEVWDAATFDATQAKAPSNKIFDLSEDIRKQYDYWRNRRNDSAHYKSNEISQWHVESFWQFIMSNSAKFVVIDSKDGLINKIKDHFDISKTPPGKSFNHLLSEIPNATDITNALLFFKQVDNVLPKSRTNKRPKIEFWATMLELNNSQYVEKAVEYLSGYPDLVSSIVREKPEKIRMFSANPEFIREFWHKHVLDDYEVGEFLVYIFMINHVIPSEQKEEAQGIFIKYLLKHASSSPEILDIREIKDNIKGAEYLPAIYSNVIDRMDHVNPYDKYDYWGSKNKELIVKLIDTIGINEYVANKIVETFSSHNYPYRLRDALKLYFRDNPATLVAFQGIAASNGLVIPENIQPSNPSSVQTISPPAPIPNPRLPHSPAPAPYAPLLPGSAAPPKLPHSAAAAETVAPGIPPAWPGPAAGPAATAAQPATPKKLPAE